MLRSDVVVVETDGLVLGKREHSLRAVVEAVEWTHLKLFYPVYRCRRHLVPIIRSETDTTAFRTTFHVRSARRANAPYGITRVTVAATV